MNSAQSSDRLKSSIPFESAAITEMTGPGPTAKLKKPETINLRTFKA